ncbi:MAG: hypothetical protein G3M78_04230 [Candidatus Nitrohelix vancouverensis]|uniref:Uncharacterized protein n=1 Tax=Candidatus Nitrohelix vancouverensis TaxID=2705534 RepID=A0A7T0G2T4_9BACT|nr:MAG: hypothetical protein G3M78_04230 [Candidatus Nitrohelix vancouverensis]
MFGSIFSINNIKDQKRHLDCQVGESRWHIELSNYDLSADFLKSDIYFDNIYRVDLSSLCIFSDVELKNKNYELGNLFNFDKSKYIGTIVVEMSLEKEKHLDILITLIVPKLDFDQIWMDLSHNQIEGVLLRTKNNTKNYDSNGKFLGLEGEALFSISSMNMNY